MGKCKRSATIFLLLSLLSVIAISGAYGNPETETETTHSRHPQPVEKWFKKYKKSLVPKFKIIKFYVQDIVSGDGQTVYPVAEANITSTSPTSFGRLLIADDRVTVGADPKSATIGRGQGVVALSDLVERALYMSINLYFTAGPYKGSTIAVSGRNSLYDDVRELAIVGGTGIFRLANGVAVTSNCSPYSPTGYTCIKYTLYFSYY